MTRICANRHVGISAPCLWAWRLMGGLIVVAAWPATVHAGSADAAWYDQKAVEAKFPVRYQGEVRSSRYLTMRDGCKIAVEIFLPEGLESGQRIPTLLHQTRYWRSVLYSPALKKKRHSSERLPKLRRFFVPRGYAWISVDVRGSGASFGTRPCEYSPDEVKDGADIVDWIIRQPWSNGKVCAAGVSYDGGTAEFLAITGHPAVKAVAPLFSMFDPYLESGFPGGVHMSWFTKTWGGLGKALDRNAVPDLFTDQYGPLKALASKAAGVRPVQTDSDGSMLAAAVRSHRYNWDLHETALRILFRDDRIPYNWTLSFDTLSPYKHTKALDASGVAVYSYSGWFDAAFAHAAIKRHLTLTGPRNRLILGPWNHGGRHNSSPFGVGRAAFDMNVELFRFFEHHLRGADTGIQTEKRVHYYTMGEEKWKAADTWPPASTPRAYYLGADGKLTTEKPTSAEAADRYAVDDAHGTGTRSRWRCLVLGGDVTYSDREKQDGKLLCYTSDPLAEDVEVTGHPVVTLHVTSPAKDGNVFAYLEDVDEAGGVHYLSEGMLRAIHRKLSTETPPYKTLVPYRTFRRADALELVPGEPAALTFDLLPVSHLFGAGHRIRVAIAGADADHFARPPGPPPTIQVHRSAVRASHIVLPVVSRGSNP